MATATLQQTQIIVGDPSDKETRKSPVTKVDGENQFASLIKANKKSNTHLSVNQGKQEKALKGSAEERNSLLSSYVNDENLPIEEVVVEAIDVENQEEMGDLVQMPVTPVVLLPVPQVTKEEVYIDKPEMMPEEEHVFGAHDVPQEDVNIDIASVTVLQPVGAVIPVQNLPQEDQIKVPHDANPNNQVTAQQDGQFTLSAEIVEQPVNLSQIDNNAEQPIVADAGMDRTASSVVKSEEMPILAKTVVDVVSREDITKHDISGSVKVQKQSAVMPELVTVNTNLVLADETRQGKSVIAKLDTSSVEGLDQVISEPVSIPLVGKKLASDNHNNSSDSDIMNQDDLLIISSGITSSAGNEFAKELGSTERSVHEQITSSIKEMLIQGSSNGKEEITINLFPEKLGAVKVEIISVLGEDGARKVESIKFTAEKRETLEILERSRLELEKSLKEVTSTSEKTSLEFQMNRDGQSHQSGAYFDSFEERNNWMNSFLPFNDIDGEIMQGKVSDDRSRSAGHITEDSVDIRI